MTNSIHQRRHQSRRRQQLAATAAVTRPTPPFCPPPPLSPSSSKTMTTRARPAGIAQPVNQHQINQRSFPAKGSLINQRQGRQYRSLL